MNKVHIIVFLFIVNITLAQNKITITQAINIAGKQRMLSQRMAKDKVYTEVNKKSKEAEKELNTSLTLFQEDLKQLKEFAPTEQLKYKVGVEELAFEDYKTSVLDNSKKSAIKILNTNTIFLAICNDLVTELIAYSKTVPNNNLTSTQKYNLENVSIATGNAGKIRYLSQRFSCYYAAYFYGLNEKPTEIKETIEAIDKTLSSLVSLEFNTSETDDSLSTIYADWNAIKKPLYGDGSAYTNNKSVNPETIFDQCNAVLDKADKLTKLYSALSSQ